METKRIGAYLKLSKPFRKIMAYRLLARPNQKMTRSNASISWAKKSLMDSISGARWKTAKLVRRTRRIIVPCVHGVMSEVNENETIIEEEAKAAGLNPDFIKAIIYVETTQGYYDEYFPLKKSIRPMNIQAEYWKDLGYSREDLMNSKLNIRAGIDLIRRIHSQIPHASISEVATLYNDLNAKRISDYGARVARAMREEPWLKER